MRQEVVECVSCVQDVARVEAMHDGELGVYVCSSCRERYEDDGTLVRPCDHNTNQEPGGLWGQCYDDADKWPVDGGYYCTVHRAWMAHSRKCANGCGRGITYGRFMAWFMPSGGDDDVLCKRCAKEVPA